MAVFQQRGGLTKIGGCWRQHSLPLGCLKNLLVFRFFLGTAKQQKGHLRPPFDKALDEFEPLRERPSLQLEILGAAAAYVDAKTRAGLQLVVDCVFLRPRQVVRAEKEFELVAGQQRFGPEQGEKTVVILDSVHRVVLGDGAMDKESIPPARVFVGVAHAQPRADDPGEDSIMDAPLGMRVDRYVVFVPSQTEEEA